MITVMIMKVHKPTTSLNGTFKVGLLVDRFRKVLRYIDLDKHIAENPNQRFMQHQLNPKACKIEPLTIRIGGGEKWHGE